MCLVTATESMYTWSVRSDPNTGLMDLSKHFKHSGNSNDVIMTPVYDFTDQLLLPEQGKMKKEEGMRYGDDAGVKFWKFLLGKKKSRENPYYYYYYYY